MFLNSRTVSVAIDSAPNEVEAFIRSPANLSRWATGLEGDISERDGLITIARADGPATLRFAPPNDFGVLDHDIVLASGVTTHVPMRVVANEEGSEVLITLFQADTITDREFSRDSSWVKRDLETLRDALEAI